MANNSTRSIFAAVAILCVGIVSATVHRQTSILSTGCHQSISRFAYSNQVKQQSVAHSVSMPSFANALGNVQNVFGRLLNATQYVLPTRFRELFGNRNNQMKARYEQFKQFMQRFNRTYSPTDLSRRFSKFLESLQMVEEAEKAFKAGRIHYTMEVNDFADKEESELGYLRGLLPDDENEEKVKSVNSEDYQTWKKSSEGKMAQKQTYVPWRKDWRESHCLGRVRNQGSCGSCYAFSALNVIEAQACLKNGTVYELAPQQVIDCDYLNHGCKGGVEYKVALTYNAYGRMSLERCYQYEVKKGEYCRFWSKGSSKPHCSVPASLDGKGRLKVKEVNGHDNIREALGTIGPLAGRLYVSDNFRLYKSGVFDGDDCYGRSNHAIVLAGYGEENGVKYWLIKNSWGLKWGDQGYAKIKRGNNDCDIENAAMVFYNAPTFDYHYT